MKTSTKFLIAYIFLALATTLVMFILSKKFITEVEPADYLQRKSTLPPFSVIVAMGNTEFNIEGSVANELVWRVPKTDSSKMHHAKLFVRNDTLFVQRTDSSLLFDDRVVIRCSMLKSVVATHKDNIELRKLNIETLRIQNSRSKVVVNNWFDDTQKQLKKVIDLTVEATDTSEVELYNMNIGKLTARLSGISRLYTQENVGVRFAEVNLLDLSLAKFAMAPLELQMVRDSTCIFNVVDYKR